jgi:16S rRNA processing protein RimM
MSQPGWVSLGYISGLYGVRGWVRVFSYTQPREQILDYQPWYLAEPGEAAQGTLQAIDASGRQHGKGIIAKLADIDDRDAAAELIGREILVRRDVLPKPEAGQYYWADLIGLEVRSRSGQRLGHVSQLLETGAHDVLVLDGEDNRLIPFVPGAVVVDVDLDRRVITVDWDAAWWE